MWFEFKDFLLVTGLAFLQAGVSIYIKAQAQVYIWGRMLEITNTNKQRNVIALFSLILFTAGYRYSLITTNNTYLIIWDSLHWFSMATLIYVLIGFDLYTIMESLKKIKLSKIKKGK